MALTISRIFTVRGCPPDLAGGINGSMKSHSSSVRSLLYPFLVIRHGLNTFLVIVKACFLKPISLYFFFINDL